MAYYAPHSPETSKARERYKTWMAGVILVGIHFLFLNVKLVHCIYIILSISLICITL